MSEAWRIAGNGKYVDIIGEHGRDVADGIQRADAERILAALAQAAEIERVVELEAALEWYAEVRNYNPAGGDPPGTPSYATLDQGMRARAALARPAARGGSPSPTEMTGGG